MTIGRRLLRAPFQWRWLIDSPLLVAAWLCVVLGLSTIVRVAHVLRSADGLRAETEAALAEVAAEAAAMQIAVAGTPPDEARVRIGRVDVAAARRGSTLTLVSDLPSGQQRTFTCELLAGAAPRALSYACSAVDPAAAAPFVEGCIHPIAPTALPQLDPAALARAHSASQLPIFRRDFGVALLAWEIGTERDDYVIHLGAAARGADDLPDLVVVPGHLWVEPGEEELVLRLDRDVTIVVEGNLYCGRSLAVEGPGRLLLVVTAGRSGTAFADRDGNGRWSCGDALRGEGAFRGAAEGAGSVYLGFGSRWAPRALRLETGLVVEGEVHLAASSRVAGPLVLRHGVTGLGGRDLRLVPAGEHRYRFGRERVAGIGVEGAPRAGLLRPVAPESGRGTRAGEQALDLATPSR